MSRDCIGYVTSCRTCNQNKKPNVRTKASVRQFHAGFPLERVHLDILGPFHTSEDGNNYVLMLIDQFTNWIEVCPLCCTDVLGALLRHIWVSIKVHTDQGKKL